MEGMRGEERREATNWEKQARDPGSEGAEDNSPILFRRGAVSLDGADGTLGPQPGGSSGQLAYRRSSVLVSRFESSLRLWPPSAPPAPWPQFPGNIWAGGAETRASVCPAASPFGLCQTPLSIRGLQQVLSPLGAD